MKKKIVIVSGYFNPLHKGHIEYFHNAKKLGDKLFVIVNNDIQRELKGSKEFMIEDERVLIIKELAVINKVFLSIDQTKDVSLTLNKIHKQYSDKYELYFANGGDQNNLNIPEEKMCKSIGLKLIDGLGKKIQSSSWILSNKNGK